MEGTKLELVHIFSRNDLFLGVGITCELTKDGDRYEVLTEEDTSYFFFLHNSTDKNGNYAVPIEKSPIKNTLIWLEFYSKVYAVNNNLVKGKIEQCECDADMWYAFNMQGETPELVAVGIYCEMIDKIARM